MKERKTIDVDGHTGMGWGVRVPVECEYKAEYVAGILARREYGKRGVCRSINLESWSSDGSSHTYQAFIGIPDGNGCTGRNVWIYL